MLLATLLLLAETPPPLEPASQVPALLSMDDYPQVALQNEWEGEVIVDLKVSTAGRVGACWIVQSSGHPVLDLKTCEIMLVRARFVPAKDQFGNPIESRLRAPKIRWQITK